MDESTEINRTGYFSLWRDCIKIVPACDNCYTTSLEVRTSSIYYDANQNSHRSRQELWRKVHYWNEQAEAEDRRYRVSCGPMMDWCGKDAPLGSVRDLFGLIRSTPRLDWQLLTQCVTLIDNLPADWGDGYDNVWLGVTVENMNDGYPRTDALRGVPAKVKFISVEPLLENLDKVSLTLAGIEWVIVESGRGYSPMQKSWLINLLRECKSTNLSVLFKQWSDSCSAANKESCLLNGGENTQWPVLSHI